MAGTLSSHLDITTQQTATSTILMAVASGGSDAPTADRQAHVLGGDVSATPYAKPQAAIDALPKFRDYDVTISIGAGTFEGFVVPPWVGKGRLKILCATALASLASGSNSGTAGTGTTSTSLVKPNAAANWTVNDLKGKRVLLTGGAGYDSANSTKTYPIKSNTTTAVSVDIITGMDSTTTFQIVNLVTLFNAAVAQVRGVSCCIGGSDLIGDLTIEGAKFNDASVTQCAVFYNTSRLHLTGSDFSLAAVYSGAGIYETNYLDFDRNYFSGANAFAEITGGGRAIMYRSVVSNSRIVVEDFKDVRGWIEAQGCSGNALTLRTVDMAKFAVNSTTATATPIYLDGVKNFQIIDAGLTGANAGASFGIEMYNGTFAKLTGGTIAGASDLRIEDQTISWAILALGAYSVRTTTAVWGSGSQLFGSEIAALGDLTISGIAKLFGFFLAADNGSPTDSSFLSNMTAHAGGGQASAVQVAYIATIVAIVASIGDSIKFRASAKGEIQFIWNIGANALDLFPPSGGTINGGIANAAISVPAGALVIAISTSGTTYRVKILA